MNTAERIRSCGMNDRELSEIVGVHLATVNRWRKGELQPREAAHIANLARALGCSPADIRPDLARVFE